MYDSATEYVTRDSYLEFSGIDLNIELRSSQSDNPTLQAKTFLKQQQMWLYNYMTRRYNETKWADDWDDDTFKDALLWQVKHILTEGEDGVLDKTAYIILRNHAMANPKWIG